MYAIIDACGKQYKVAEGDIVFMERLEGEEGTTITFEEVVMITDDKGLVTIGEPTIKGAKVKATVIGHGKGKKFVVFKYKAKKNERKSRGHRWCYTKIQIEKIALSTSKAKVEETVEVVKDTKKEEIT